MIEDSGATGRTPRAADPPHQPRGDEEVAYISTIPDIRVTMRSVLQVKPNPTLFRWLATRNSYERGEVLECSDRLEIAGHRWYS